MKMSYCFLGLVYIGYLLNPLYKVNAQSSTSSVEFTVTTSSPGGNYSPKNIGAIWIEDASGNFVKTLKLWANKRKQYLYTWNSATGGNTTDAVTGATLTSHQTHTATWDVTDTNGSSVADGNYKLKIEMTDAHAQGPLASFDFPVGEPTGSLTPPDETYFHSIELNWFSSALPIQLSAFTADLVNEGVSLKWRTESELNCFGFHILRCESENEDDYTRISTELVPAHGTTSTDHEYALLDTTAKSFHTYFYKIEELTTDGKKNYYGPIQVTTGTVLPGNITLFQNYPNPFNPATTIEFALPQTGFVTLTIYNLHGEEITTLISENLPAGNHKREWNAIGLASGVYVLAVNATGFVQTRKMVLLK